MASLLVVDDDLDLAQVTAMAFRSQGHSVRVAIDGRDGLRCVLEETPDLVILDAEMPHLDGPEMAYRLFLHDLGAERIPIVLVSAVANLTEIVERVGTPYFLAKPCRLPALLAIVDRALQERVAPNPQPAL